MMKRTIVALVVAGCESAAPAGYAPPDASLGGVDDRDGRGVGMPVDDLAARSDDSGMAGMSNGNGPGDATAARDDARTPLVAPGPPLAPGSVPAYGVHTANALPASWLATFAANDLRYMRYNFGAPAAPDDDSARAFDGRVREAAERGVYILPMLIGDRADVAGYERFAHAVAARFGPTGSFWRENPAVPFLPVRAWEVWNEPNLPEFWDGMRPATPDEYRALLGAARRGLRAADPQARVIFAGLSPAGAATRPRVFLRGVAASGGACLFDAVAIHPYAGTATGAVEEVRAIHDELESLGLRGDPATDPQVWVTEWGWAVPADGWPASGSLTARGENDQADLLGAFVRELDDHRGGWRVGAVFWFNDRDIFPLPAGRTDTWWLHCGLLRRDGGMRPSWFRLGDLARRRPSVPLPPVRQCGDVSGGGPCGDPGQACCAREPACPGAGVACFTGTCQRCGDASERCCPGDRPCPGADVVCAEGTCRHCGEPGQPCCNGASPCPGASVACVEGTCRRCGAPGQPCCPGSSPCPGANVGCYAGTCRQCGDAGERCCPGNNPCAGARLRCRMDRCE